MLVYANSVKLEPEEGIEQIIQIIATWVGKVSGPGSFVEPQKLIQGIKEFRLKEGITLTARSMLDRPDTAEFPKFFSARLSHPDSNIPGRRWTTEIGLRHDSPSSPIDCSIILKTDEISARVNEPVKVTRPRLMLNLFEHCRPTVETPGLFLKTLTDKNYISYLDAISNDDRRRPIVLVSVDQEGKYKIDPERVRGILVGLADIYSVGIEVNTFKLEALVGRRFVAFGGAVRIVFPKRKGIDFNESILLTGEKLSELAKEPGAMESEILATITHRTNIPISWQHISLDFVNQVILRSKLKSAMDKQNSGNHTAKPDDNLELLELAYEELSARDTQFLALRDQVEEYQHDCGRLQSVIESLQYSLSGKQDTREHNEEEFGILQLIRNALKKLKTNDLKLEEALWLCSILYQDRLIVLETAFKSARESDASGFKKGCKAYELLIKLSDNYWELLDNGGGDQEAKQIFGNKAYAANEANLSSGGRRSRTFLYKNKYVQMDKHLKDGNKDSAATTLRIHFEWFADTQNIVIGHCGRHLDL
ncbi:hypothetical protein ACAW49_07345 [Pseudomonas sp. Env-44]|jgi:hypothetical protein|uniref:hypothetical protein n=1 Tax=unclassified Pseudomonas TaxID=196821 RepID=UPI0011AF498C